MKRATVSGTSVCGTSVCGTSVRPATVPALVLCAVLMTWTEAAWAGEEPLAPFPGTSVPGTSVPGVLEDGGGESAEAPPPALGAVSAGPAAGPIHPGAAGDETAAAADVRTDVPGVAVPGVDAGPSGAAAPGGAMAAKEPATPAGGSRLLRALAELPIPGAAPAEAARHGSVGVPGTSVPGTSVFAAEGCPRALLRRLLAGAAGEADALSALGIEREILTLCRERQEIVAGLLEAEARLSELREAGRGPDSLAGEPEPRVPAPSAAPAPKANTPVVERAATSPLRAALGAATKANEADTRAEDPRAGEPRAAEPQPAARVSPARVSPRYAWFSIIGTAGALRAGVTDGTGVWFVREGDPLPGGARIAAIAGRPPGVRVTGAGESGEATLLPFRARPGAGP